MRMTVKVAVIVAIEATRSTIKAIIMTDHDDDWCYIWINLQGLFLCSQLTFLSFFLRFKVLHIELVCSSHSAVSFKSSIEYAGNKHSKWPWFRSRSLLMKVAAATRISILPSSSEFIRLPSSIENSKISCNINIEFSRRFEGATERNLWTSETCVKWNALFPYGNIFITEIFGSVL